MTKRTNKNYPNDFKQEAVSLVTEQGYSVVEAAASLNITDKLLYNWVAKFKEQNEKSALSTDERAELIQLRKDKKRLQMEREILKKASEDSSHQSNRYTKLLICMRTLNETIKTYIYHRRERPCF
jgi:transposase